MPGGGNWSTQRKLSPKPKSLKAWQLQLGIEITYWDKTANVNLVGYLEVYLWNKCGLIIFSLSIAFSEKSCKGPILNLSWNEQITSPPPPLSSKVTANVLCTQFLKILFQLSATDCFFLSPPRYGRKSYNNFQITIRTLYFCVYNAIGITPLSSHLLLNIAFIFHQYIILLCRCRQCQVL